MIADAETTGLSTFDVKTFDSYRERWQDLGIRLKAVPFSTAPAIQRMLHPSP